MMTGDDVLMMPAASRIEVFTGTARRRRWSAEQKARIIEESYATSVGEAAARHGVSKSQLFNWRREARDGASLEFARVEIEGAGPPAAETGPGVIEVALGGGLVRLSPGADRKMALAIIMALKAGR
jgi:transposase